MINTLSNTVEEGKGSANNNDSKVTPSAEEPYDDQQFYDIPSVSYEPLDNLILNSPFYKKFLKADKPYQVNQDKEKIVGMFTEKFTSKELDSTIDILEKRMSLSNETSLK